MKRRLTKDDYESSRKTATQLRAERMKKGKTAKFVAERMDITQAYLCDLERGYRCLTEKLIRRYRAALEI